MSKSKKLLDFASEEDKKKYLDEVIGYFLDERGEEIGYVAAEEILDFFTSTVGIEIYKKGIADAKKLLKERMDDIDFELDALTPKS